MSQAQIERTLDHNHDFVQAARPELERLSRAIAGTSFFALITEAQGVVVDVGGAIDKQDKRVEAIARIGIDLSEQAVGTTAISAALNEKNPSGCTAASLSSKIPLFTVVPARRCGTARVNA